MEEVNRTDTDRQVAEETSRAVIQGAIPGRIDRLRYYGKSAILWGRLSLQGALSDLKDFWDDEALASSFDERREVFAREMGRWAIENDVLTSQARERYLTRHPELDTGSKI